MTDRRVLAVGDRPLRLLDAVDVRHDDPLRAGIEDARSMVVLLARHAHDRGDAGRKRRHRDLGGGVEIHRAVFHVDEEEVVAAGLGDHRDVHGAREAQSHAERDLAFGELLPGVVVVDAHVVFPVVHFVCLGRGRSLDWRSLPSERPRSPRMLKLYFSPGVCSMASHIGLEELGVPYEKQPTLLPKGEHKTEAYLKVNPRGKVPALEVDGKILTENTAILTYLAKRFPEKNLIPKDPFEEARCISPMAWSPNCVHPPFTHTVRPERFAEAESAHDTVKETGKKTFWSQVSEIDPMLQGKRWIIGVQFT